MESLLNLIYSLTFKCHKTKIHPKYETLKLNLNNILNNCVIYPLVVKTSEDRKMAILYSVITTFFFVILRKDVKSLIIVFGAKNNHKCNPKTISLSMLTQM